MVRKEAKRVVLKDAKGDYIVPVIDPADKGGSGLELCDIGMALYVDETKGLRRYLNGQIVDINTNTQAFLDRLLEIKNTNPDYFTTEATWQSEATLNIDGCVYKFVLNYSGDNVVSVRLPKYPDYVEINAGGTLPVAGNGMTLGLTDGVHDFGLSTGTINGNWGLEPRGTQGGQVGSTGASAVTPTSNFPYVGVTTNPTKSGIQTTLKQTKLKMRYFIQIATGSETENNIINEIELNNPYSLFDSKYSDHELNNLSWLKSSGQWNSRTVYVDAYNELLAEYNNAESAEETEGTVTFKRTPKGYKVALADQETAIDTKYSNDGIAWYYILDTTNEKFKLPRTKFGFEGLRTSVGDDIEAGLPNITGTWTGAEYFTVPQKGTGAIERINAGGGYSGGKGGASGSGFNFDASRSNQIYGKSNTVQPPATQMYLYFYVGETVQNANLIDAGRIGEQLANKQDKCIHMIDTYVNGTSGYIVWSNGYCEQWGRNKEGVITLLKTYKDTNYNILVSGYWSDKAGGDYETAITAVTETSFTITLDSGGTQTSDSAYWKTCGYIA